MSAARARLTAVPDPAPMVADEWDLRDYPQPYLDCRAEGHDFPRGRDRGRPTHVRNRAGVLVEVRIGLMCRSCQLTVTEITDARTGARYRELPAYPEGYLRKGQGRLPRWQVRLEEIRRLQVELGQNFDTVIAEED